MQNNTLVHFPVVVLCTNLFLICNSNNLIPFKEYFFRKLLHLVIEVEKIEYFVWLVMFWIYRYIKIVFGTTFLHHY